MNQKTRIKIIKKLSQTLPTDQTAQTTTLPAPAAFEASNAYPSLRKGYNSNSVTIINNLVSLIHEALHYASAGAMDFQKLKNMSFNIDTSKAPPDQRNLLNFAKKIYTTLLNSGTEFLAAVSSEQIHGLIKSLLNSLEFNNLSSTNTNSIFFKKYNGTFKNSVTNFFNYLLIANPIKSV